MTGTTVTGTMATGTTATRKTATRRLGRADDRLHIGVAIPGVVPRIALVIVVAAAVLVLQPALFLQIAATVLAIAGAALPRTGAAWLGLLIIPIALALGPIDLGHTCVAIAAVHLGHLLATMALTLPMASRIAVRALRPTALRALVVQGISQALALIAFAVPAADGPGIAWAAPIGAVAVALLAARLLHRIP